MQFKNWKSDAQVLASVGWVSVKRTPQIILEMLREASRVSKTAAIGLSVANLTLTAATIQVIGYAPGQPKLAQALSMAMVHFMKGLVLSGSLMLFAFMLESDEGKFQNEPTKRNRYRALAGTMVGFLVFAIFVYMASGIDDLTDYLQSAIAAAELSHTGS